jgi:hypothetical protein
MKISNILPSAKPDKMESFFKFDWLPTSLPLLVSAAIILTTVVAVMQIREQASVPDVKSLAWYTANPKVALADNKICFDNPQLKATENCLNSLHALEIMHKGPNS